MQVYSGNEKRYVQGVLQDQIKAHALWVSGSESKVAALLCGHKDMCIAVTTMLTEAGVSKDKVLLNF